MDFFEDEKIQSVIKIIEIFLLLVIIGLLVFEKFFKKEEVVTNDNNEEVVVKEEPKEEISIVTEPKDLKVDIKGAIKNPGVYTLKEGSIINDLLEICGGVKSGATLKNINLSKKIEDEMVVYIYTTNELNKLNNNQQNQKECVVTNYDISPCEGSSVIKTANDQNVSSTGNNNNSQQSNGLININKASLEELMSLSGIGEAKAKAIIEFRNQNGEFKAIEDIMNVSGIGEAMFAKIKDSITV